MRLMVIISLGLGVWEPMLIDAEKVVFVVPRYIRRSYGSNTTPFVKPRIELQSYKIRELTERPFFASHYGPSSIKNGGYFAGDEPRVPKPSQGRDDFDHGYLTHKEQVNHVVIPHGKGISHGISFGKGYIPRDQFDVGNDDKRYEIPSENANRVNFAAENHQSYVKFEEDVLKGFKNKGSGTGSTDWPYGSQESRFSYDNATPNRGEQSKLELQEVYKSQGTTSSEEPRKIFGDNFDHGEMLPSPAPLIMPERKLIPIILRDTIDMKEYIEKVEAFAKGWPSEFQGFKWKNQVLNPISNYQSFNPWENNEPKTPSGSYEVQEDSVEEPDQNN